MTRVALIGRIPGGLRPRGTIDGQISAAGARATVRWDDGLTSSVPTQHLVALPAPRTTVWQDPTPNEWRATDWRPEGWWANPTPWNVDCERDGQFVGTEQFATEAEARAWAARWY